MDQLSLSFRTKLRKYHPTTSVNGKQLMYREAKAGTQDAQVLSFLKARVGQEFTAAEVHEHVKGLLGSVRRSLTNLKVWTHAFPKEYGGRVIKTSNERPGLYGHENKTYTWIAN